MFSCNNYPFGAFVTMIYWTSTEVLLNLVPPLDSAVPSFDFEQINVFLTSGFDSVLNHFCLFRVHLMLVYHSVQLSHTWSDFSRLLTVMISETRILCHFILVLLSSILMKQLTCNVGIISLRRIFGLDI